MGYAGLLLGIGLGYLFWYPIMSLLAGSYISIAKQISFSERSVGVAHDYSIGEGMFSFLFDLFWICAPILLVVVAVKAGRRRRRLQGDQRLRGDTRQSQVHPAEPKDPLD